MASLPMLVSPFRLNSKHALKNRLAVAPMTTTQSNPDGTVSEAESRWLERLASDGYGLVITCAAAISKKSIAFYNQLSLADDTMLPGLTHLAERLKPYKSKIIVQLCHGGSRAIPELTGISAYSASSYKMPAIPNFVSPQMLSESQIAEVVADFAKACERAARAGFDGIEFHGANGYLFTQFVSTMTNLRSDKYGGDLINRARFAREVVQECRKKVPDDFIIGFRMSFENAGLETGLDIDENIQISNWLIEDGIDYLHISNLKYDAASVKYPGKIALQYINEGVNSKTPIICAGGINTSEDAIKALDLGADMVALGRAAIGNDKIPERFSKGEAIPFQTPYSVTSLVKLGISDNFIAYIKNSIPLSSLNIL
jgi:2,4-dienoyl-CoA reductase-like NADH-dependent reductase (Old Yellow Enzyme family)